MSTRIDWHETLKRLQISSHGNNEGRQVALRFYYPDILNTIQTLSTLQISLRKFDFNDICSNTTPSESSIVSGGSIGVVTDNCLPPRIRIMHNIAQFEVTLYQQLKALQMSKKLKKFHNKTDFEITVEQESLVHVLRMLTAQLSDAGLLRKKGKKRIKFWTGKGDEAASENPQSSDGMLCDYCQSSNEKNRFGQREELLVCKDCSNKAHPSCLNYSKELVEQIRSDGSWQCIDCKACSICDGTGDPDTLLFCDACDKGYHMQCHTPKLEQTPSGKWACATCIAKGKSVSNTANSKQVLVIDDEEEKIDDKTTPIDSVHVAATVAPMPMATQQSHPLPLAIATTESTSDEDTVMVPVTATALPPTNTVHPQRIIEKPQEPVHVIAPVQLPTMSPPVISVKPSNVVYQSPNGLAYAQLPIVSTPVSIQPPVSIPPGHAVPMPFPINQQHHLIPVNYMLPNGAPALPPHFTQPQPLPPQPSPVILGKGMHNELTHILNPKVPLPDVRSSIREDVLRALPPDVADWTVQNVVYYFKAHGYIQESKLLEEQEIDGRAMLLMSRNDCLTGLRIKLGPALKIYHMHIHKLQKRTDFLG